MKRAAEAIIAALSVQSESGTSFSRSPSSSQSASVRSRSSALAATPPPSAIAGHSPGAAARSSLATSWSTIARWKEAARSARRRSVSSGPSSRDPVDERRLQAAEAEVEPALAHRHRELERPRDRRPRRPAGSPGRPDSRARAAGRPCRRPRRPRRPRVCAEDLEARSARGHRRAACGRRSRSGRGTAARADRARGSWPRRARAGGRPGSSGLRCAAASALAVLRPTSSAPIRPGPWVTAIASDVGAGGRRPPRGRRRRRR